MDIHSDFMEPATPALSNINTSFWRAEDSGYHTSSFTPGSENFSEISNENLDPATVQGQILISGQIEVNSETTPESNYSLSLKYVRGKSILASTQTESTPESPIHRRGVKRSYDDTEQQTQTSVPTPTSAIAGGIQKMRVSDSNWPSQMLYSTSSLSSRYSEDASSGIFHLSAIPQNLSYPSTPVKKTCRTSCKLSPMRKSNKKLNFVMHSLSCESRGVIKQRPHHRVVRTIKFLPDQKIDIIKMLCQDVRVKILSYLSNEDICNFKLVSHLWYQVWHQASSSKKQEFNTFLKNAKDNQENIEPVIKQTASTKKQEFNIFLKHAKDSHVNKGLARKNSDANQHSSLKEVHNVINMSVPITSTPRSPPGTPRTNKFKKFAKCAQSDSRIQLPCVKCHQPSKVTKEPSGEEWAECSSVTCSYRFCKYCNCPRHPGKTCFTYDLDGPSPSKRRRNSNAACTSKSKKSLHRLKF